MLLRERERTRAGIAGPDPELLIEEARRRARRRRRGIALVLGAVVVTTAAISGWLVTRPSRIATSGGSGAAGAARACPDARLGLVAFVRSDALHLLDLSDCRTRVVARGALLGSPSFSGGGRYLSFSRGFVATNGGPLHRLPGGGVWSPRTDVLAMTTPSGGLELVNATNGKRRRLLPDGWGAGNLVFSPDGRMLAVTRHAKPHRALKPAPGRLIDPWGLQVWILDLATGSRRLVLQRQASETPGLLSFSPDGRWLIAHELQDSASLDADGSPLVAINVRSGEVVDIGRTLGAGDHMTWCGDELVYTTDFGGRISTLGEGIDAASPPSWRSQSILPAGGKTSWDSVDCTASGNLLIAGGPASEDSPFGQEHRSLYELQLGTRASPRLIGASAPTNRTTDELPLWSTNGHWLLYIRTSPFETASTAEAGRGRLYAVDLTTGSLVGPIANLGVAYDYYGSYRWGIAWYRG